MTVSLTTAELAKYIDATALKADTSEADVRRLVAESREAGVKSVCINPVWVPLVAAELADSDVLTCTVIGFPLGANASEVKAELKKAGFTFCGPTIVYAVLQATGLVNDHLVGCFRHAECAALAAPPRP